MKKSTDYHPFIPTLDYPRVKAMHGRSAAEHEAAGYANPLPRSYWMAARITD